MLRPYIRVVWRNAANDCLSSQLHGGLFADPFVEIPEAGSKLLRIKRVALGKIKNLPGIFLRPASAKRRQPLREEQAEIIVRDATEVHERPETKERRPNGLEQCAHLAFPAPEEDVVDVLMHLHDRTQKLVGSRRIVGNVLEFLQDDDEAIPRVALFVHQVEYILQKESSVFRRPERRLHLVGARVVGEGRAHPEPFQPILDPFPRMNF